MKKIRNFINYLLRDELDDKRIFINMSLLTVLIFQLPITILNVFLGEDIIGILMQLLVVTIAVFELWIINKHIESDRPLVALIVLFDFIVLPIMYFTCGGHSSAMLQWTILGGVIIFALLEGKKCNVFITAYLTLLVAMLHIEMYFPNLVMPLESEHAEISDQLVGTIIITITLGILFWCRTKTQARYRKQLEDQASDLEQTNKQLESANKDLEALNKNLETANERLGQASEAKSHFLANMSHEIRTPINAVLGMDEMILRESHDENILKYAADIDSAGHQLLALINDILDFSKIESGKMEVHPAEYEMFSIVNDCYNMVNMRARKKSLEIRVENDPNLPSYLIGDEVRVRQIAMNLLTNAVKYTKDGYVKFSLSKEDIDENNIYLIIEVKDTGIGISEENLSKLFGSFERVDEITNRNIEGTGLGLAITKKFLELMNGSIEVKSVVGEGSVFTARIPQVIASKVPMGDFASKYNNRGGSDETTEKKEHFEAPSARIMVVDDVKMNLNVVRLLLKSSKIQVDMASSGAECLQLSMLKSYDVILMDHMMPEMDGIQTLHEMRKVKRGLNASTPVIALTANAIVGVEEMYKKEGFADYMSKPIKGDVLEEMLIKYIPKDKIISEKA